MKRKAKYNPQKANRKTIRLKDYDYSQPGMYFVTVCCQDRKNLFGEIRNGEMFLNDAGKMIEKWYLELSNKFPNVECGDYVVMPNHFHAIVILLDGTNADGTNADGTNADGTNADGYEDPSLRSGIPAVMQWFKTMTTNEYIRGVKQLDWQPFNKKIWQRSYYEHIIRNKKSYINIKNYINNNPKNWANDKLNKMNRINKKLQEDKKLLSIYFTAGYPQIDDTVPIIEKLQESGADMLEIGLPFSDPLADGPTIQASSTQALKNGMTTEKLFNQLKNIRKTIQIPLIIMGYFNPILQYGVEAFCEKCAAIGIDGLIIPDLPVAVYHEQYQGIFEKYGLINVFLITPQTSEERIRFIDSVSNGFIYMVSSASVTGAKNTFGNAQTDYFERIDKMKLNAPQVVGFGISNNETFNAATHYAKGAIIGSAFIKMISEKGIDGIESFISSVRG